MFKMLWLVNKAEVAEVFNEFALSCICGEGNHKKIWFVSWRVSVSECLCYTYVTDVEPEMSQIWRYGDSFSTAAVELSLIWQWQCQYTHTYAHTHTHSHISSHPKQLKAQSLFKLLLNKSIRKCISHSVRAFVRKVLSGRRRIND